MLNTADFSKKQIVCVFTNQGDKVSFLNDNVVIKDKEGKTKHQSTCYRLFMICIIGNISLTSGIIQRSKKFGFAIVLMNQSMRLYEFIGGRMEGNTILRMNQYFYNDFNIGRLIAKNKIENQRNALNRIRSKDSKIKEAINNLDLHASNLEKENMELKEIMGVEGSAARIYFSCFFDYEKWSGRKPRIKCDFINSSLDIGYTILFNFVDSILGVYGFDTYCGVLHRLFYMRKSLVCDIMEPFRPIIDLQVKKGINLNQIKEDDFELFNNKYVLKFSKNAEYVSLFLSAVLDKKDDIFKYIQSYYRAFMKHKKYEDFPKYVLE